MYLSVLAKMETSGLPIGKQNVRRVALALCRSPDTRERVASKGAETKQSIITTQSEISRSRKNPLFKSRKVLYKIMSERRISTFRRLNVEMRLNEEVSNTTGIDREMRFLIINPT